MSEPPRRAPWYWEQYIDEQGKWSRAHKHPPGGELAAMRRGLGKLAGSVPQMWRFHEAIVRGERSPLLDAEHAALCLYAVHQQSQRIPMHHPEVGLGEALRRLSKSTGVSEDAVTHRFNAAATATSFDELVSHLRGLVTLLRSKAIPLDYSALLSDLWAWSDADRRGRVRRRWGMQFHAWESPAAQTSSPS